MQRSNFLNLNLRDVGRGLLVAVITAVLGGVWTLWQEKELAIVVQDFVPILEAAIAAGIAYLGKNLFENKEGDFGKGN